MKKIFISEVIKYALIISISVIALVWASLSRLTMATLERTLESYLQSSINIIDYDKSQHNMMLNEYKSSTLVTASDIALLIKADNSYLTNQAKLNELRRTLKLDEILVTDVNMQIVALSSSNAATQSSCVHFNDFVSGIHQNNFQKYTEPSFCDRYKEFMQYTGVSRLDKNGIIITGRKSSNISSINKSSIMDNLSSIYSIYKNGFIVVIDKNLHTIISYKDNKFLGINIADLGLNVDALRSSMDVSKVMLEGYDAFALLRDSGDYSFIAVAFKKDVYSSVYVYLFIIIISIALMVIFMQLFMLQVVNQHIISGISYIICCLDSITKDNLDTKVELNTCDEFSILSDSINSMVSRLRNLLLSEKQLVQEKAYLAAVKGDFLAMMSHEIRTPLNVIIGMAQIGMRSNFDDNKKRDTFADINMASTHLLGLLNDILDISKIDAGKLVLSNYPFSIEEDITYLQLLISAKAREQELSLLVETDGIENVVVNGDKLRLNQVLLNLLSNAMKFTEKNKQITLSVKVLNKTDENISIRFMVVDEGIGMSREKLDKIFNPFEQADTSITRSFGGTGLGLSISKSIVELMGGKINVESKLGQGSRFWFDVTFDYGVLDNADSSETSLLEEGSLSQYRALIVDDALLNRKILYTFLEKTGIKMEEAASGEEAIEKYMDSPVGFYNIIFMDIHMPNMNGYETAEKIRRSNKMDALTVPIIAVTADAFKETEERVLLCGMNGFIFKPLNFAKLSDVVKKVLGNQLNTNERIMVWNKINNLD